MTATSAAFDIATYLAAAVPSYGTVGGSIGVNTFLDIANNEIAVFEFSGTPDLMTHGMIPAFEYPKIQIQVRNVDAIQAFTICKNAYDYLRTKMDLVINGNTYTVIKTVQRPKPLERDDQNRVINMCEFELERRAS